MNNMLASRQVDGLIWLDLRITQHMIRQIKKQNRPFVLLQQETPDRDVNTVCIKSRMGAYEAMLHWLKEHNIRVPEDIALVGYDGIDEAKYTGLTTVETPMYEMGVLAAQHLIELIEDPPDEAKAKQIVLTGQLIIRESCGVNLAAS